MTTFTTRSGRIIKKPELFKATEEVLEDDYHSDEYDSDFDSDLDTEDEQYSDDDEEGEDDDEEMDENGNLKGFVVDESESESEE